MLGLGSNLIKAGTGAKGIVTDNLVLNHGYALNPVQPLSDGAADINADAAGGEYIDVGAIPITTNDVTMSAWVYVTEFVDYAGVISNRKNGGAYQGVEIRTLDENTFSLAIDEETNGLTKSISGVKNTNQWYHVCGVMDRDGSQYLYVDGVLEDSDDIVNKADSLTHTTNAFIGSNYGGTEFRGYICNVGYWNRVLSQAEVKSIMNKNYAGLTSSEKTSLVSWWNLDSVIDSADLNDGDTTVYDNHHGGGEVLGSEITPASDFSSSDFETNPTSGSVSEDNGTLTFDNSSSSGVQVQLKNRDISSDKTYKISFTLSDFTSGTFRISVGNNITTAISYNDVGAEGTHTFYVTKTGGSARNYFYTSSTSVVVSNISVKLVNGNTGTLS